VKLLLAENMIVAASTKTEVRGRPATVFRVQDRAWLTIGMNLELADIVFVLCDVLGRSRRRWLLFVPFSNQRMDQRYRTREVMNGSTPRLMNA